MLSSIKIMRNILETINIKNLSSFSVISHNMIMLWQMYSMSPTSADEWELDRSEMRMKDKLGGGQYGDVYEAKWIK